MKIKYVGLKQDGERAFFSETNIEWRIGDAHDVDAKVAAKMLKHPDVFAAADAGVELSNAKTSATPDAGSQNPGIPEWAKAGIDAGLTDEQLEKLASLGGPESEDGMKFWLETVGKPFNVEPPAPKFVMRHPNTMMPIVLDGMKLDKLKDLAAELRIGVSSQALEAGHMKALVKAFPLKTS
jgi:hypothetical protein